MYEVKGVAVDDFLKDKGLSIPYEFKFNKELDYPLEAFIDISNWKINIQIHPDLSDKRDLLLYTLLKHEEGHWKICPYDSADHMSIRASVCTAFREVFKDKVINNNLNKSELLCGIVVNIFEDLIVDKVNCSDDLYKEGIEFILEIHKNSDRSHKYVLSDLMLSLREGFLLEAEVDKKVKEILINIGDDLLNKNKWISNSYNFSIKIFKYIKNHCGGPDDMVEEDLNRILKQIISESIHERKFQEDGILREEMVKEYFKRNIENKGIKDSPVINELESLDCYYQSRIEDIRLEYSIENKSESPITYVGKKKLEERELISVGRIKWAATKIVNKQGKNLLYLYEKQTPLYSNGENYKNKSFFDLGLILDSSDSMGKASSNNSKYSILITAIYSLFNHLTEIGKDLYMNYCFINFSSETFYSGWRTYNEINTLKKEYLLKQQCGGTNLNTISLKRMTEEAKSPFLAIMVTDGDLDNPDSATHEISNLIEKGNEFCLIRIGKSEGNFTNTIRKHGADIYEINDVADLSGLILKKGESYW